MHELLTADWTYLNDSLARHYGIEGVLGSQFRRVTLEDAKRWGLLGKGATLLRTSYGDRTSPVLRGAWVLDRILGTPPAPPPPNVEVDLSIREGEAPTTVRARLEVHRENPTCQACHGAIDPPGLALENFDLTGRWRDVDRQANAVIDASTILNSGIEINGPSELREHLLSREDQLPATITKRLMMYAMNREIEYFDMPLVREIVRESAEQNYTFASIITGIVNSRCFSNAGPGRKPRRVGCSARNKRIREINNGSFPHQETSVPTDTYCAAVQLAWDCPFWTPWYRQGRRWLRSTPCPKNVPGFSTCPMAPL